MAIQRRANVPVAKRPAWIALGHALARGGQRAFREKLFTSALEDPKAFAAAHSAEYRKSGWLRLPQGGFDLARIVLLEELVRAGRCEMFDWKEDAYEVSLALDRLADPALPDDAWDWVTDDDAPSTEEFLVRAGDCLAAHGFVLVLLPLAGDTLPCTLVRGSEWTKIARLDDEAAFGLKRLGTARVARPRKSPPAATVLASDAAPSLTPAAERKLLARIDEWRASVEVLPAFLSVHHAQNAAMVARMFYTLGRDAEVRAWADRAATILATTLTAQCDRNTRHGLEPELRKPDLDWAAVDVLAAAHLLAPNKFEQLVRLFRERGLRASGKPYRHWAAIGLRVLQLLTGKPLAPVEPGAREDARRWKFEPTLDLPDAVRSGDPMKFRDALEAHLVAYRKHNGGVSRGDGWCFLGAACCNLAGQVLPLSPLAAEVLPVRLVTVGRKTRSGGSVRAKRP